MARTAAPLWARLLPPDSALAAMPAVRLDADGARAFSHGQSVAAGGRASGWLRVYGPAEVLLGVGQGLGDRVKPERLLHADPQGSPVLPA
jgi:hypothetical protein